MEFVNIYGQPVSTSPLAAGKKRQASAPQQFHKGWLVVGYSPAHVAAGRAEHEASGTESRTGRPFDLHEFMTTTKPKRVRHAPYEVYEAAVECKAMAERAGWVGVRLEIKAKGGGNA